MLAVTGHRTTIVRAFRTISESKREREPFFVIDHLAERMPPADRFLFAHGLLVGKAPEDMTLAERMATMEVNYSWTAQAIDEIVATQDKARIVVIGSESAVHGSFDHAYADAKSLLHRYVERKRLRTPDQQLVAISPGIISDSGMTARRKDTQALTERVLAHPKRRFVTAAEVAELAYFLLYQAPYISGTVVHMHGGVDAWRR